MKVLVSRHPLHDLVTLTVGQRLAGVVVSDPGGQFLEGEIGERIGDARDLGRNSAGDLGHPSPLKGDGVDMPAHDQVIP